MYNKSGEGNQLIYPVERYVTIIANKDFVDMEGEW
jgi:hypothetical protein